ncbi:MAG: hypothetical protein KJ018_21615 [Burkholderiales bacterium]|nr:hypothetical protein [Burkholderiales bacterium]GIK87671.1 MAG: hypothetical protein BroJett026_31520 [Betaproteobacteria bacterium]
MTEASNPLATMYGRKFDDIDRELAGLATACKVDLLDRAVLERVLRDDASVCGAASPAAFAKLRQLLMMHYAVRTRAAQALGEGPTQALIDEVVDRLRERLAPR